MTRQSHSIDRPNSAESEPRPEDVALLRELLGRASNKVLAELCRTEISSEPTTDLLPPGEAAGFLQSLIGQGSAKTLAKLRCIGGGPKFRKIGRRRVMYAKTDLVAWASAKISAPLASTSSAA
jgi:hypothetical protein